eukprot:scaffold14468_cov19-Tisochrysis_lutea.AAC.1
MSFWFSTRSCHPPETPHLQCPGSTAVMEMPLWVSNGSWDNSDAALFTMACECVLVLRPEQ